MTWTAILPLTSLALLLSGLTAGPATAGEVVLFEEVPSVRELDCVLFDRCLLTRGLGGRGVVFKTGAAAVSPQGAAVATNAPPEPTAAAPPPAGGRGTTLGLDILFAYDSAEILPESRPYLQRLGEVLHEPANVQARLAIVGHTDDAGPDGYNLGLSRRRAKAVRAQLAQAYGIDPGRLSVQGVGKREPLLGLDPLDPRNRRVEFYQTR